ncbi:MAG: hypothetical protein PHW28_11460 [Mesotoga sp.]|nr:hypothetical protein [Mesotoga sp.]
MTEEALSRATSRDDTPSRHPGVLQARISIFETVASDKMQVEKETVIRERFTVLRQEHGPVLGRAVLYS